MCVCLLEFCRAMISLVVGIPLGLLPGVLTALGIIAITLVRYPLNLYKTFQVTIMTALLKKRLKFLILVSLTIIQILYPVIAVIVAIVVSVVGWCGACVSCVFTLDQDICKLFNNMPKLLKVMIIVWCWLPYLYIYFRSTGCSMKSSTTIH